MLPLRLVARESSALAANAQVVLTVTDYHAEGHDAYHPVKKTGSYQSQKEEAKPYVERFKAERMPK